MKITLWHEAMNPRLMHLYKEPNIRQQLFKDLLYKLALSCVDIWKGKSYFIYILQAFSTNVQCLDVMPGYLCLEI
jgi:hypothetical protein